MALTDDEVYIRLIGLLETVPDLTPQGPLPDETLRWLGRAHALVQAANVRGGGDAESFKTLTSRLTIEARRGALQQNLLSILYRALAHAELKASPETQGAFLLTGATFDAFAAIEKILKRSKKYVRIVDPYMDANALTEFAVLAPDTVQIQLLSDRAGTKPGLAPAVKKWQSQYVGSRPLEARVTPPLVLHDRIIDVDGSEAWILTQSLNKLVDRSPASVTRAIPEVANLKIPFYESLWMSAQPLT